MPSAPSVEVGVSQRSRQSPSWSVEVLVEHLRRELLLRVAAEDQVAHELLTHGRRRR